VAAVVSTGPTRRVLTLSTRVALMFVGSFTIAASVAVTLWTRLGPGPLDVFIGAVRNRTGLPISIAVWVTVGTLIAVAWLLGRRPGPGTMLSPFLIGPMLQSVLAALESFGTPDSLVVRFVLQVIAIGGLGIGSGALIVSGLGAGSGELLASAGSDRVGRPEHTVRLAFESTWIVVGVALGGPAGLGTVMVAATIGPAVSLGHRIVDSFAAGLVRGFDTVTETVRDVVRV
jgi:uncharacterized membrane protein YczE